jgi:hypothetical protein
MSEWTSREPLTNFKLWQSRSILRIRQRNGRSNVSFNGRDMLLSRWSLDFRDSVNSAGPQHPNLGNLLLREEHRGLFIRKPTAAE